MTINPSEPLSVVGNEPGQMALVKLRPSTNTAIEAMYLRLESITATLSEELASCKLFVVEHVTVTMYLDRSSPE